MIVKPFIPLKSQNPVFLEAASEELCAQIILTHGGLTYADIKEDGHRIQIHKQGDRIEAFKRSRQPYILPLYPELEESLANLPDCILDAELRGDNDGGNLAQFHATRKRARGATLSERSTAKYFESGVIDEFPMTVRVFDTLYWEGESLIDAPLADRRKRTESIFEKNIIPTTLHELSEAEGLAALLEDTVSSGSEGLVCKRPSSLYVPGSRTTEWIKLKRSEPIDLAILGVYLENETMGRILCGSYNDSTQQYESLCTVNAKRKGMNAELEPLLRELVVATPTDNMVMGPRMKDGDMPDYFTKPEIVVEVRAMNFERTQNKYACGLDEGLSYSLRIGWLSRIRDDKLATQATTTAQIGKLYEAQKVSK